ncbi:hypothetical protein SNE40_006922 [Patella caerulea]|uniref:RIMS-binding protein 2 n=1 Tax=Patella caerulea TaxID=87958 RepID=A0AAN8PWS9_PATCE
MADVRRDSCEDVVKQQEKITSVSKKKKSKRKRSKCCSCCCVSETEKEDSGMESNKEMKNPQEIALSDSRISSLSKKGQIYVYVAKYDYDPYTQSPNETPDSELPLNAGDYVLVFGEMDEDGFYEGELVDGRKGLVPSNFIEQVDSDHLADFHAAMAMAHSTVPVVDDGNLNRLKEEFDEYESSIKEPDVAYPRALSLDRQLSNGIYISWKPPDGGSNTEVQCYQVYVDGKLKSSVRGNERTKALVENIDMKQLHRVCVRCVTKSGHSSKDAQCTILVGKDSLPVPSEVRVSDVTATCATINWLPGNTNYQHSILVNGREASVVHAGVCRYTLTGLDPGTSHRIIVRAKNQSLNYDDERSRKRLEQLSAATEFRTKDAGPPDPPIGVQLETGPQEGTLLLTWIPVSLKTDENSSSSGVVIGYNIYIDGRKAKEATGATNDHIILYSADFNGYIPKQISVRTLASDGTESDESELLTLNNNLIKEISAGKNKPITPEVNIKAPEPRKLPKTTKQTGHAGPDTDEEIESAFLVNVEEEQKTSNAAVDPQYVEPYLESSSSELSDIQEVEEDLISTEETNSIAASGEAGGQLANQMKKSPRPVPSPRPASRKKSPSPGNVTSVEAGGHHGKHLSVNCNRDIPAIEITRDSSTEKSFEDEGVNSPKSAFSDNQSKSKSSPKESPRKTPEPLRRTHVPPKQEFGSGGAFRDASRHKQELAESDRQRQEVRSRDGKSTRSPVSPAYDRANTNPSRSRHSSGYSGHGDYDENGDVDSISGEINPPMDDNHVRLFIALFDYDPTIMSPNVEYIDEELPFREGQILKVYGDKDADGFYRGECNGQMGYIPCNMVSEIHIDDPELVDQLISESQGNPVSKSHLQTADKQIRNSQSASSQLTPNGISSSDGGASKRRMVALYDYDPQELSPNVDSEIELSFKAGDIIMVSGDMDEDGFYMGEMNGVRGFVPSNFLQDSPLYDDEVLESASMVSPSRSGGSISTVSRQSESLNNVGVRGGITDMHVAPSPGSDGSADYTHRRNIATHRTSTTELRQPRPGSNNSPEVANARRQAQEKRRNFE